MWAIYNFIKELYRKPPRKAALPYAHVHDLLGDAGIGVELVGILGYYVLI